MREIKVTGKGKLTVVPDRTILSISLKGLETEYKNALEQSKKLSQEIKNLFMKLGFENTDIKTRNFEIEARHEREYDENDHLKMIFKGYEFIHDMSVEFDKNNELLGKIMYELSSCTAKPELSLQYTVKDVEKQKNELLTKAIHDSKKKAKLLADASEVILGKIVRIDYSWGEMKIVSSVMDKFLDYMPLSTDDYYEDDFFDMDVEPENINISDTVTVVWEII